MRELPRIAHVILGVLSFRPASGYDIKAFVDGTTRYFWAASYGQIYPELRRLAAEGLVEGESVPQGERARTLYRLTPAGREALRAWLASPEAGCEVRDEGLLKLFFAGVLGSEGAAEKVAAMRAENATILAQLEGIAASGRATTPATRLVLDFGLGLHGWVEGWCAGAERRLAAETGATTRENRT